MTIEQELSRALYKRTPRTIEQHEGFAMALEAIVEALKEEGKDFDEQDFLSSCGWGRNRKTQELYIAPF